MDEGELTSKIIRWTSAVSMPRSADFVTLVLLWNVLFFDYDVCAFVPANSGGFPSSSHYFELQVNKQRYEERSSRQEQRIYELELLSSPSSKESAELKGLKAKSFVEQYDPSSFTDDHVFFKKQHNEVFRQLCIYCGCGETFIDDQGTERARQVFFLDGPDAGTKKVLLSDFNDNSIQVENLYIANRHKSTCEVLTQHGLCHVVPLNAEQALKGPFRDILFGAYYFDGCGGHPPILIDMIQASLESISKTKPPIAIGFSIVGGNRDVVDKELVVLRALVELVKPLRIRVHHVLHDCERYGIDCNNKPISKVDGNTLTSWAILEEDFTLD